jgi:hypothetical protein
VNVRICRGADCDIYHHLVKIKYQQGISGYKNVRSARQRKYVIRKVRDEDIVKKNKKEIRKGIGDSNEQQNNQNEETGY